MTQNKLAESIANVVAKVKAYGEENALTYVFFSAKGTLRASKNPDQIPGVYLCGAYAPWLPEFDEKLVTEDVEETWAFLGRV